MADNKAGTHDSTKNAGQKPGETRTPSVPEPKPAPGSEPTPTAPGVPKPQPGGPSQPGR